MGDFPAVVRGKDVMVGAGTEARVQRRDTTNSELWKLGQSKRIALSPEPPEEHSLWHFAFSPVGPMSDFQHPEL